MRHYFDVFIRPSGAILETLPWAGNELTGFTHLQLVDAGAKFTREAVAHPLNDGTHLSDGEQDTIEIGALWVDAAAWAELREHVHNQECDIVLYDLSANTIVAIIYRIQMNVSMLITSGESVLIKLSGTRNMGNTGADKIIAMQAEETRGEMLMGMLITGDLTAFQTDQGTPSTAQTYHLRGIRLTNNITITAPTGFELSEDGVSYSSTISLAKAFDGDIYVRMTGATVDEYNGNVTHESEGVETQNLDIAGEVLALPLPTAIAATLVTDLSFTANWEAVSGADSYELDVSTANTFTTFVSGYEAKSVTGTSQSVTGLSANVTYYYRVRSVFGQGISGNSNVMSQITFAVKLVKSGTTHKLTLTEGTIETAYDELIVPTGGNCLQLYQTGKPNGSGSLDTNSLYVSGSDQLAATGMFAPADGISYQWIYGAHGWTGISIVTFDVAHGLTSADIGKIATRVSDSAQFVIFGIGDPTNATGQKRVYLYRSFGTYTNFSYISPAKNDVFQFLWDDTTNYTVATTPAFTPQMTQAVWHDLSVTLSQGATETEITEDGTYYGEKVSFADIGKALHPISCQNYLMNNQAAIVAVPANLQNNTYSEGITDILVGKAPFEAIDDAVNYPRIPERHTYYEMTPRGMVVYEDFQPGDVEMFIQIPTPFAYPQATVIDVYAPKMKQITENGYIYPNSKLTAGDDPGTAGTKTHMSHTAKWFIKSETEAEWLAKSSTPDRQLFLSADKQYGLACGVICEEYDLTLTARFANIGSTGENQGSGKSYWFTKWPAGVGAGKKQTFYRRYYHNPYYATLTAYYVVETEENTFIFADMHSSLTEGYKLPVPSEVIGKKGIVYEKTNSVTVTAEDLTAISAAGIGIGYTYDADTSYYGFIVIQVPRGKVATPVIELSEDIVYYQTSLHQITCGRVGASIYYEVSQSATASSAFVSDPTTGTQYSAPFAITTPGIGYYVHAIAIKDNCEVSDVSSSSAFDIHDDDTPIYLAHESRCGASSITDEAKAKLIINWLNDYGIYDDLISGHISYCGVTKDESDKISKAWDICSASQIDLIQGTANNQPVLTSDGFQFAATDIATALFLVDSAGQYTNKLDTLSGFTLSVWLKPVSATVVRRPANYFIGGTAKGLELVIGNNQSILGYARSKSTDTETLRQTNGNVVNALIDGWVHIVMVVDYSAVKMHAYLNGVLKNSGTPTYNFTQSVWTKSAVTAGYLDAIGATHTGADKWIGAMEQILVFGRVLTSTEIADLYGKGR